MPVLVQKIIFDIIPKRSPFLIRPLVSLIFGQLDKQLVQPAVTKNLDFVCASLFKHQRAEHVFFRSNLTCRRSPQTSSRRPVTLHLQII